MRESERQRKKINFIYLTLAFLFFLLSPRKKSASLLLSVDCDTS